MRIGLFMTPQWQPGADLARGFDELAEQARTARDHGFSSLLVGQHVVTGPDMLMFQCMPLIARLLPEAQGMQIGPGVLLLSMMNPVMAAEEGATIDCMSGGHYVLAAGLGYREAEFEAMGVPRRERASRIEEAVALIKRLWTEERVTHHGRHFHLSDSGASVRPVQRPRPPIWLGGDVEPAIRRAARIADAWLAAPTTTTARLAEQLAVFDEERAASGQPPAACPVIRECFAGRDRAHVRSASRGPLLYKYQAYAAWGQHDASSGDDATSFAETFDDFCSDRFLLGDVAQIRDGLAGYAERFGTDHLLLRVQWPGLAQAEVLASMARIGKAAAGLR